MRWATSGTMWRDEFFLDIPPFSSLDFVSFLIFLISFFSWRSIFSFHCFRLSSFLFRNPVKNSFRALSSNTTLVLVFLLIALLGTVFSVPMLQGSEMLL